MLRFFKAFTLFLSIVERKTNNLFLQMRKTFRRGWDVQIKESRIIVFIVVKQEKLCYNRKKRKFLCKKRNSLVSKEVEYVVGIASVLYWNYMCVLMHINCDKNKIIEKRKRHDLRK